MEFQLRLSSGCNRAFLREAPPTGQILSEQEEDQIICHVSYESGLHAFSNGIIREVFKYRMCDCVAI